jgi:23S rRNA pseudouridine1911/1915/1917 synthase
MAAARTFRVRPALAGQNLAAVLARLLPKLRQDEIRRLLARKSVDLNGNPCADAARRINAGDVVKVYDEPRTAPPSEHDVRIRFMDEHLLVVEKPPGVTTLRQSDDSNRPNRRADRLPTLHDLLQRQVNQRWRPPTATASPAPRGPSPKHRHHPLARRGSQHNPSRPAPQHTSAHARPPRVIPVHRLDRETSGLMLFALSPRAEQDLSRMFKQHAIDRTYLAVVHGHPAAQTIDSYFIRDRGDGLRGSTPRLADDPTAQHAVTHIKPLEPIGPYSLVECRLETGRTHQIRIHLAEAGHMLCGEPTYTRPTPTSPPTRDDSRAPRLALHSADLRFTHPVTGKAMHFHSALPPDLSQWLGRLRRQSDGAGPVTRG